MIEGKIFVAAGHSPERPGAGHEGFYEHDEAVRWVAELMRLDGASERLVRVPDGVLQKKVDFINYRAHAERDAAIEVHFNAAVDEDGNRVGSGSCTLYMPGSVAGERLARTVQRELAEVFPPDRGVVAGWYRGDSARGAYFFLQRTKCRAVIIEPEFVHRRAVIEAGKAEACARLYDALTGRGGVVATELPT